MQTTIELLDFVRGNDTDRALAHHLHISPTTISMARKAGRTSPELAGRLAVDMTIQESAEKRAQATRHWVAIAVAEQLPAKKGAWLLEHLKPALTW